MSLWTCRRSSAFKRPSDIVLRWSDLTNPRAELARSTDVVVTGVTSSSFRTCRTFGNKSSCPETLVFPFFPFFFFCRHGGGGGARPRPPPPTPWIRYWTLSYRKLELAKMFCWRPALASNLRMHAPRTA